MSILKVEHVSKTYGRGQAAVHALDDVSLSIEKGEFVAIIGSSGSGKSTLLHVIGGVDKPTKGKIFVDDTDLYSMDDEQLAHFRCMKVGLIYQFFNLVPVLNVEENIMLPAMLAGEKIDEERLGMLLKMIRLTAKVRNLPNQLSGGQQQRVAIARALMNNPSILLADEPTGNLDSANTNEVMNFLKRSNTEFKQTLIIITHDEKIASRADRIIELSDGKIISDTYS